MAAKKPPRTPKYRLHRASGQGFVELNGKRHYLGRYDLPDSKQRYHRLVAEWMSNGRRLPVDPHKITVSGLIIRCWEHAENYYVDADGVQTSQLHLVQLAMRPLKRLYGPTRAAKFGPSALRVVRQTWIDARLSRRTVNAYTGEVVRLFKWAVSHELIPGAVHHALVTVQGLRRGRSAARETEPVKPVPEAHIDAVRPLVSLQVRALIDLQVVTGGRAGELLIMRPVDLNMKGSVWEYKLVTLLETGTRLRAE